MSDFIDSDLPLPQIVIILWDLLFVIKLVFRKWNQIIIEFTCDESHLDIYLIQVRKGKLRGDAAAVWPYIFRLLIRSIGLHHCKVPSLRLLSYWGSLKSRKIPPTERGDLKSWTPCPTTKETLSFCTHWIWPSLSEILPFFFIACRVSNLGGVKFVPCFKNNIPKQTWWIRGDISF